jgi:predicted DsbA family dithiol-disulfide isomerase
MSLTIPVAHDFICPWCWVGLFQAERLRNEFNVSFDWVGHELWPEELEWPEHAPAPEPPANKPATPTRLEFILLLDELELPKADRPKQMRTHNAHEAVEFAKTEGVADELIEKLYRAYWEEGLEINNPDVLVGLAEGIVKDHAGLKQAMETKQFKGNIVSFDDESYSKGVYNVPTFFIGESRLAEQPYKVLSAAVRQLLG